jgi:hypothetical protein
MSGSGALDPHPDLRLVLGSGLAQNDHGIQRLGIQPRHQVNVLCAVFLPKLANLNFRDTHKRDFDFRVPLHVCQLLPSTSRPNRKVRKEETFCPHGTS